MDEIERRLEVIWRSVLNVDDHFSKSASFFALGGDSLKAVTLYDCLHDSFGFEAPVDSFFDEPTFDRLVLLMARKN